MLYTLVFTSLKVILYIPQKNKFTAMLIRNTNNCLYKFVFELVYTTANRLIVRPICSALYIWTYKFVCNLIFSTTNKYIQLGQYARLYTPVFTWLFFTLYLVLTNKFTVRPICNAPYTSIHKFVTFHLAQQVSQQLGWFARIYTYVFTGLFVKYYFAQQTS